jgi:hypothetical protein
MRQKTKEIVLFVAVLSMIFLLSSCFTIYEVNQPCNVDPGQSIQVNLKTSTNSTDENAKYGILGLLIPNDWEVDSVYYDGDYGQGTFSFLHPDSADNYPSTLDSGWADVMESMYPSPDDMHWTVYQADTAYAPTTDTNYVYFTIDITVGNKLGAYKLGYLLTEASLDFDNEGYWDVSLNNPIGVSVAPTICSVVDVPDDQGGWVYLTFKSGMYDLDGGVTQYGVWEENPEGEIVSLGNVPAVQDTEYVFLAHTFGNTTPDGEYWSKFVVTAHTSVPELFYASSVDSGQSIDNLAPATPSALIASVNTDNSIELTWSDPVDEDFKYFKIYRGLTQDFDPAGTEAYDETTIANYGDTQTEGGITYYYIVSSIDYNGNESEFSEVVSATTVAIDDNKIENPTEFSLRQNYPNPFNPATVISYSIKERVKVSLKVYNIYGREVATLVNEVKEPGVYRNTFSAGSFPSGVYFYKLHAGNFTKAHKMILAK